MNENLWPDDICPKCHATGRHIVRREEPRITLGRIVTVRCVQCGNYAEDYIAPPCRPWEINVSGAGQADRLRGVDSGYYKPCVNPDCAELVYIPKASEDGLCARCRGAVAKWHRGMKTKECPIIKIDGVWRYNTNRRDMGWWKEEENDHRGSDQDFEKGEVMARS